MERAAAGQAALCDSPPAAPAASTPTPLGKFHDTTSAAAASAAHPAAVNTNK